ncbi:MAG: NAD+ synthase (glutamine-hydrolyzing) [Flavobacteriales bacterium]|jgi:NAD+ synthase (glutamine-hydrolysing)
MLKIAVAQLNYHIGDFRGNLLSMQEALESAKQQNVDLIVFSELAICGYPPRDLLEFNDFIDQSYSALDDLASKCRGISAIVGAPARNKTQAGKSLFNAAFLLEDGLIKEEVHKSLLPNYDIFDEYRYFEPNRNVQCIIVKGCKIALTICEDLWNVVDPLYTFSPMDKLLEEKPDLMINIAASPFDKDQLEKREEVLNLNCKKYNLPLIYVNHIGAQTELIFDGNSLFKDRAGRTLHKLAGFEEELGICIFDRGNLSVEDGKVEKASIEISRINDALVLGIRDYFRKLGFRKAVLGLSGGIDSAVTLALASDALGPENVHSLLMPSMYSSKHSIDDSVRLCENLGSTYEVVPISAAYEQLEADLMPLFKGKDSDVTEENLQARLRGVILMAYSNKHGNILLNTSNKSEAAVGYGTLYGDMNGGISVLGDVYKTEVFELAEYMNRGKEFIPINIITKPPSAELRPDQKDSDSLPDYAILDKIIHLYVEQRMGPNEIIGKGFDEALVVRVLRLINMNEYKRFQTPPILRVSSKAFGMGRRMPIVGKYLM